MTAEHSTHFRTDFVARMGLVAQAENMPNSAWRVFALLVYDGGAVAFGAPAEMLKISRGSVSTSLRPLEERGLVRPVSRPGERQDFFEAAATLCVLPEGADGPRERLRDYQSFYEAIDEGLRIAISRFEDRNKV